MQDPFAHGAELVRATDRDRFIASLFAPAEHRGAICALYAFNSEVSRVRETAREALPGEIRLQWWNDVINRDRDEEARANPVAAALLTTIERYRLSSAKLVDLIEARRFDLYDDPIATVADLETYARKTSSALLALAAQILAGTNVEAVATPAGIAFAIAGLLRAFPRHAARGQLYVPMELLDRHQVHPHDIFAGRSSAGLQAAFAELRDLGRRHLDVAHQRMAALPPLAMPALLPVALVRPALMWLEGGDPFSPAEIAPWRRQWLIWRAARHPARIAG
ncbi:MAG: squalene/phytoene synthase family protein [Xanthobacteraceae bacterium]|jgi:phytoene synthase